MARARVAATEGAVRSPADFFFLAAADDLALAEAE